ncbi:hypothetical protein E4U41_004727, partial [Claviceps citrina]
AEAGAEAGAGEGGEAPPAAAGGGGVFVHCAAGKSRSVSVVVAYLLWRYPDRFDPSLVAASADGNPHGNPHGGGQRRSRRETAEGAVEAALASVRRTRPMAEPNDGFMQQLALWWEMGCPAGGDDDDDNNNNSVEHHALYQRWAYRREVEEHVAVGQAPSRLRFEDEDPSAVAARRVADSHASRDTDADPDPDSATETDTTLRCKKCRRTLATTPFINQHVASTSSTSPSPSPSPSPSLGPGQQPRPRPQPRPCPHHFVEPLSWMRRELERGQLNGRLICPNERCGAAVGRYDWKGIRCACGGWVTPGLSLQRARVDEEVRRRTRRSTGKQGGGAAASGPGRGAEAEAEAVAEAQAGLSEVARSLGIRMPPGASGAGRGGGGSREGHL